MMTLNYNLMFEEKTLYNFDEVLKCVLNETGGANFPATIDNDVIEVLQVLDFISNNTNLYGLSYVGTGDDGLVLYDYVIYLFNKLHARYKDHWAIMCNDDTNETKIAKSEELMIKLFNLLDYNYPKYSLLLTAYEQKKNNMLDKLGRTRSGNRAIAQTGQNAENSVSLYNDTPQTTDVVATIEGNQYVSDLTKTSVAGSTASNGTDNYEEEENFDTKTIMEKLEEIQRNYAKIWKVWLDEFDELFIEEVNF